MQWTQEQQSIIHSTADKLLVQAFAGTGKTTTLVGYATQHASVKMLYLCYNKSVELAVRGRFPRRNVVCKTAHGLAYAVYGSQYATKQTSTTHRYDSMTPATQRQRYPVHEFSQNALLYPS